jgi:hypothetical protein
MDVIYHEDTKKHEEERESKEFVFHGANWVCLFGFASTHGQDAHATGAVFTFQTAAGRPGARVVPSIYGRDVQELCENSGL